jgi:hypothetical protein
MNMPPAATGWLSALAGRSCHAWMAVAPMHTTTAKTMIETLSNIPFGVERMERLLSAGFAADAASLA